jgi:hypothetical protein
MKWAVVVTGLCLLSCSVYDDEPLTTRSSARAPSPIEVPKVTLPVDAGASATTATERPCVRSASVDYCTQLPALGAPPAIDGTLECGLTLSPMQPLGWQGPGAAPDKRASFAAAWHREGLYAFVEVRGQHVTPHPANEPVFCGDAVELYVDDDAEVDDAGTYDEKGTMQFVVAAPRADAVAGEVDAWRFTQGVSQGAWISKTVRVTALPDGYTVEAFITAADLGLWQWNPSLRLGFSVAIDLSAPPGADAASGCSTEAAQFFLRLAAPRGGCPGEPWCDARAFCDAELLP